MIKCLAKFQSINNFNINFTTAAGMYSISVLSVTVIIQI